MDASPQLKPMLLHAEPVLAVSDIAKTVNYYHEVLGFPEKWMWGEPPNHGGVSWNGGAFLQFSLDPETAKKIHGESVWLRTKQLENLFELHQKNNVDIVAPMTSRPWGFADYVIRDINGYYITFAEPSSEHKKSQVFPSNILVSAGTPNTDDARRLCESVGWAPSLNSAIELQLKSAVYAVIAQDLDTNEIIGCAFLLGDHKTTYYVKDVIVHPTWQHRGIGTAMMKDLMDWLETNGTESATVGLFTGDNLAPFYRQFGFTQACGMYKQVRRKKHP
jgi:GNAT superfamily N-acetyltransferase